MKTDEPRKIPGRLIAALWLAARHPALIAASVGALLQLSVRADDNSGVRAFLADVSRQAAASEKASRNAVPGTDGWLFFVPELRALSVGPFWGEAAKRVSRSSKPEYADPLPAIVDFHDQLHKAGIELLVMPVPAKAAVYPEAVSSAIATRGGGAPPRVDQYDQEFYGLLKQQGVAVIDLLPLFLEHRDDAGGPLYCKTDSHWSGRGVALAAQAVFEAVKDRDWFKSLSRAAPASEARSVEMTGDLARMLNEQSPARETLPLTFVGTGGELTPLAPARDSPVLLMGDSHTLIFHDPTLVARGAGLPDHLAQRLGIAVDLIGVRGSGATTTRIELLRRKDNLQGKKLVIWCFSFREFTESTTGWRKVPVIRK
ncbi:MAG: alginate O-acetyltransferase AlgX-related protein [Deltaproteobacteria bacterium]